VSIIIFLKAFSIGFMVAAVPGPIFMFCIRKTLEIGLLGTISVAIGVSIADAIYGMIVVSGMTAVSNFLEAKYIYIKIFGGLLLLYLAYKEISERPNTLVIENKGKELTALAAKSFVLTSTNPMTGITFLGIFASIGKESIQFTETFAVSLGVFSGSMLCFVMLGIIISMIKHKISDAWMTRIRYLSAIILAIFGGAAMVISFI
jgi:putative LysE/RhtB family amino acid efflux pump